MASASPTVSEEIQSFVLQNNYPCVAAIRSVKHRDFRIGTYRRFGTGESGRELRRDLQAYLKEQRRTGSTYFTYWAVYDAEPQALTESDFEASLWRELSHLTSAEERAADWGDNVSDPEQPGFCLSIDGTAFFVVGLYPGSSRVARRFSRPALVFNTLEQFENLERSGEYEPMKRAIRSRDLKLQGSVNPMVALHGDKWEAIQFSGRANPSTWKCPFKFLSEKVKSRR